MHRVENPTDIPAEPHFAVMVYRTARLWQDGDCFPGQGYWYSINIHEHWVTTNKDEIKDFIKFLQYPYAIMTVSGGYNV